MITCPLCQNEQARGFECDVCGRRFPESMIADSGHTDIEVEPVPGLEPTVVPPIEDEPKASVSEGAPCNWCGHAQQGGRVCDRCGMQRHRGLSPPDKGDQQGEDEEMGLCAECGFSSPPPRCNNCGTRVVLED